MTIELYLLIGVTFTLFMEHFYGANLRNKGIAEFILLLFLSSVWPAVLSTVLIISISDWVNQR